MGRVREGREEVGIKEGSKCWRSRREGGHAVNNRKDGI